MAERRVLLIDPDPGFHELLQRSLAPYGVVVHMVDDGTDGLGHVSDVNPEVVFISVELPDKAGYSTCNKAKRGVAKRVPVVLTTSTVPPADLAQHRKLKVHADEYLDKRTVTAEEIVRKLDALVSLGPPVEDTPLEELPAEAEDIRFDEESHAGPPPDGFHVSASGAAGDTHVARSHLVDPGIDAETDAVFAGLMDGDGAVPLAQAVEAERESSGTFEEPKTDVRSGRSASGRPLLPPPLPAPPSAGTTGPEPRPGARPLPTYEGVDLGLDSLGEPDHTIDVGEVGAAAGARLAELEAEVARLHHDLEEARKTPAPAPAPTSFSREREFLNLREIINRKEKEILDLRDETDAKDRVILGGKDRLRELDRKLRDHEEKLLTFEGNLVTANESIAALREDKDRALERERGLKARIDIAQAQLRKADEEFENVKKKSSGEIALLQADVTARKKELEAEKKTALDRVALMDTTHAAALRRAGDDRVNQLAALRREVEQDRDDQLAAQRADLEGRLEKTRVAGELLVAQLRAESAKALAALQADRDQALARAERDRKAELAEAAEESARALAEAENRRQTELQAAENRRAGEVAVAEERRRAEVAETRELGEQRLEELRTHGDEELHRLRAGQAQALAAAEDQRARELAALAEKKGEELAAAEERRQRELQAADERRMKELLTADSKRREDAASAEDRRQRELAAAEERRVRELTLAGDKHAGELGVLVAAHDDALGAAKGAHATEAAELRAALGRIEEALGQTRARLAQTEGDLGRTQATLAAREAELGSAREELADRERRVAKQRGEIVDLERENGSFQEQLLKAFQRIKSDEAIASKAKKALAIALTLLDGEPKTAGSSAAPPTSHHEA